VLTSLQALLRLATLRWLGVFICALATLLAATSSASALERAQTKTRVWGFDFAEHNSVGLFRAASSGKHQGNRLARAEEASGSLLAARGAPQVLGRGSTANIAKGTTLARNLREELAIEQAMASPTAGRALDLKMTDPRWPATEGWTKMQQVIQSGGREGPINVHYLLNQTTGAIDDFKIVLQGAR
jgi:hypothetical protein